MLGFEPTINLASVPDKITNDLLGGLTTKNAWIGGYFDETSDSWAWSDGSQWNGFEAWGVEKPSNDSSENYLMFNQPTDGAWSNVKNNAPYAEGYFCQYDPNFPGKGSLKKTLQNTF